MASSTAKKQGASSTIVSSHGAMYFVFVLIFVSTIIHQSNLVFDDATAPEGMVDYPTTTASSTGASRALLQEELEQEQEEEGAGVANAEIMQLLDTTTTSTSTSTTKATEPTIILTREGIRDHIRRKKRQFIQQQQKQKQEQQDTSTNVQNVMEAPPQEEKEDTTTTTSTQTQPQEQESQQQSSNNDTKKKKKRRRGKKKDLSQEEQDTTATEQQQMQSQQSSKILEKVTTTRRATSTGKKQIGDDNNDSSPSKTNAAETKTTTSDHGDQDQSSFDLDSLLDSIITKWEIQDSPNAKTLLSEIWYKDNSYNSTRDLIVFTHPMKTGGTSVSLLLNKLGKAVPGSAKSGMFNFKLFKQDAFYDRAQAQSDGRGKDWTEAQWRLEMKSLYSHSPYRSYGQGADATGGLLNWLNFNMPNRRIRHITMVREPLAFVASNFNEWQCKLTKWAKVAHHFGIKPIKKGEDYAGCDGFTVEMLAEVRKARNERDCKGFSPATEKTFQKDLRKRCKGAKKNSGDHLSMCSSVSTFLNSADYQQRFHNHGAYGRCTDTTNSRRLVGRQSETAAHIEGALKFLGGLDAPIVAAKDPGHGGGNYPNGDMMWHGITERMKDSMCLLHYQLKLPWERTPTSRVQKCRPVNYWKESDRAKFYEREPMMMAVHRAANAVLDLQLAKMRFEVTNLQKTKGDSAIKKSYIGSGCLELGDEVLVPQQG